MSVSEPTLLETYVVALRRQNVDEPTIALLSALATEWIDVLRHNPRRLGGNEITLLTVDRIDHLFRQHFDVLWSLVIDPDQGFGRMGTGMRPFLIE